MKKDNPLVQKVACTAIMEETMLQIRQGAFLTVQAKDKLNLMTIGWASIGNVWAKPVIMVMVRPSRYTYEIIENSAEFTVSVPATDRSKELAFCGAHSGRGADKFKACNLEIFPGLKTHTPVVNITGIHFECGIVYKSAIDPKKLVESYGSMYKDGDYHTLYFGEILEVYRTLGRQG